ncbi:MAG TPA: Dabb family protein [Methylococcus sp.]|nr:Dabb family protein [Methylococcus sp.]
MRLRTLTFPLLLFAFLAASAARGEVPPAAPSGPVHHVVIVWLKEHGSEAARQRYIENSRQLGKLPMVVHYRVGTALPSDQRTVVDSSYDVAIVASFANREALGDYLAHPEHRRILDESLKPLVDRVVVYDFQEAP